MSICLRKFCKIGTSQVKPEAASGRERTPNCSAVGLIALSSLKATNRQRTWIPFHVQYRPSDVNVRFGGFCDKRHRNLLAYFALSPYKITSNDISRGGRTSTPTVSRTPVRRATAALASRPSMDPRSCIAGPPFDVVAARLSWISTRPNVYVILEFRVITEKRYDGPLTSRLAAMSASKDASFSNRSSLAATAFLWPSSRLICHSYCARATSSCT